MGAYMSPNSPYERMVKTKCHNGKVFENRIGIQMFHHFKSGHLKVCMLKQFNIWTLKSVDFR